MVNNIFAVEKSLDLTREPKMDSRSNKPELGRKLKVFADTDLVNNFLKYDKFEVCNQLFMRGSRSDYFRSYTIRLKQMCCGTKLKT